jgi:RNA polymerase sigma factor (sigma-70 family)
MESYGGTSLEAMDNERLVALWQTERDERARVLLLERYSGLADSYARKAINPSDADDVRQAFIIALLSAIEKFDPSRGAKLTTLILYQFSDERLPFISRGTVSGFNHALVRGWHHARKTTETDDAATERVCRIYGASSDVVMASVRAARQSVSIDAPPSDETKEQSRDALISKDPTDEIIDGIERKELRARMRTALSELGKGNPVDLSVLGRWIRGETQAEIALEMGVSKTRVGQRMERILDELAIRLRDFRPTGRSRKARPKRRRTEDAEEPSEISSLAA